MAETPAQYQTTPATKEGIIRLVKELEAQMKIAAKGLDFEKPRSSATGFSIYAKTWTRLISTRGRNMANAEFENSPETRQERRERKLRKKKGTHRRIRQRAGENIP